MKEYIATIGSLAIMCLIFSSATAVPYSTSRPFIEKIEKRDDVRISLKEKIGNTGKNLDGINQVILGSTLSVIGIILGLLYVVLGLGFLYATVGCIISAYLAFILNPWPGVIVFSIFAAITGILSTIFLTGGFALLFSNNPTVAVLTLIAIFLMLAAIVVSYLLPRIDGQNSTIHKTIIIDDQEESNGGYLE